MRRIATVAEIPVGTTKSFIHHDTPALLVHDAEGLRAYVNVCTHEGGLLELVDRDLCCCLHGARFNPRTGKALCGPAPLDVRLTAIPLTIIDGGIYVEPPPRS